MGNILLIAALISSFGSIIISFYSFDKFYSYLASTLYISAFLYLLLAFITSDFSVQNVFLNSSTIKPLQYKIAGAYASHEGSILMWLAVLSVVIVLYISGSKINNKYQIILPAYSQILFGLFILLTSNPLTQLSFKPKEGLGLNPALQDMAIMIHPPILYLGQALTFGLFIIAITSLLKRRFTSIDQASMLRFSSLSMFFLTLGIGLGSWWAYRELGWGGYWFFDPVENISLLPWLAGIAIHHCLSLKAPSRSICKMALILSILSFLLIIFGMALIRSGILTSVHAFAVSGHRAYYLCGLFLLISLPAISLLFARINSVHFIQGSAVTYENKLILKGNFIIILSVIVLLAGIIYPICSRDLISVENNYYELLFLPLVIPALILASGKKHLILKIIFIILVVIVWRYEDSFLNKAIIAASFILIASLSRSAIGKIKPVHFGHLGFAMLAISICLNIAFKQEINFVGREGDSSHHQNFDVKLDSIKYSKGPNYYIQGARIKIENRNGNINILQPENRYYILEKTISQESDIYSYLTHDIYAVMSRIDDQTIYAKIYYQPAISFIWLSVFLIAIGFLLSYKRLEI